GGCSSDGGENCLMPAVLGPVCPPETPWDPYRQGCCEVPECFGWNCDKACVNGECIDLKATGLIGAPNWDAWIPFVLIALLIGYLLAAIAYMVSHLITSPELYAWAKNEFYEVSASAWFVGSAIFFIGVLNLMLVELGGMNLVETASLYTARVSSDILAIYSVIVQGLFALGLFSYLGAQFGIGVPIGPIIIGIQGGAYPFGGLVPVMQALGTVTNMLSFGMFAIILQRTLLEFISDTMLRILLPIGIFLRCFTLTRKIGATLMALAIGLYVVYPLTLIMNAEIYASVPRLPQVEYNKNFPIKDFDVSPWMGVAMGPDFKKYCQHWYDWVAFCWLRAILIWIFAFIKALVLMVAFVIKTILYAFTVGITGFSSDAFGYFVALVPWAMQPMIAALFLPVLDIIIVFTAVRSLSEAIGGETRISGLLEFI
ncbi:MAG: hypothetical protein NT157_00475, partial [Candidatus Micrarchaeota archaeon]|nr:hypothetical protein [Candidatus Micrarchaeota archaeon]